ncbi:MAG: hypothetical protein QOE28_2779, partial [Solirubrobacteraceae bacterium]|nr:hypothetical protein [Solirubrobacteraceae bacterium]
MSDLSQDVREIGAVPSPWRVIGLAATTLVVVAALAAAAGWELHGGSSVAPAPAAVARTVQAGALRLTVPGDWASARPAIESLDPASTVAFAPYAGVAAQALVTLAPLDTRSLVPARIASAIAGSLPAPVKARLGTTPAWRYPSLALSKGRTMDLTVAASTAGTVAIACIAPAGAVAATDCAGELGGVALVGARWLNPSASLAFRLLVPAVVDRLDARRHVLRQALAGARHRRGQARAAGRLALAYARAEAGLKPLGTAEGAPRSMLGALEQTRRAYVRLGAAAATGHPKRYRLARRAITRDEEGLRRAIERLLPLPFA